MAALSRSVDRSLAEVSAMDMSAMEPVDPDPSLAGGFW